MTETSSTTQACERSWIEAQALLLAEWARLTDKERTRLVKGHGALAELLDQLETEWEDYRDAVTLDARRIVETEQATLDGLICCVLVADDGDWVWWALPEVDGHLTDEGFVHFIQRLGDQRLLIRAWATADIAEIRNVPKEHPFLEQTTEFTLASQGQPFWTEEDQALADAEGALGPEGLVPPLVVWGPQGAPPPGARHALPLRDEQLPDQVVEEFPSDYLIRPSE